MRSETPDRPESTACQSNDDENSRNSAESFRVGLGLGRQQRNARANARDSGDDEAEPCNRRKRSHWTATLGSSPFVAPSGLS